MLQEAGHIKNTVALIFWHSQCLHLMNSEVAWVLVSPDCLSVSYDYVLTKKRVDWEIQSL